MALIAIEGTNCDEELARALGELGASPEIIHLKQLEHRDVERSRFRTLSDYSLVFLPGGFSSGDYVRAGAIFAARLRASIGPELEAYVRSGRLLGGVCNGFQVLIELGLLPGRPHGELGPPEAALMTNDSGHFECRPTWVEWSGGAFRPLSEFPRGTKFLFPSAHGEGKLVLAGTRRPPPSGARPQRAGPLPMDDAGRFPGPIPLESERLRRRRRRAHERGGERVRIDAAP